MKMHDVEWQRAAAICRQFLSLGEGAVRWHWSRHFRGYYCKSKYIWKNRTINQNYQNLIWIQSLGYTLIHIAIPCQTDSNHSDPDQRTLVSKQKNRELNHVPRAGILLKTVSFFFYLEAGRRSDGGRREAAFLKFFLCESADSASGAGNVSSWTDSISFFGLQMLEVNGWGWRSWSTW